MAVRSLQWGFRLFGSLDQAVSAKGAASLVPGLRGLPLRRGRLARLLVALPQGILAISLYMVRACSYLRVVVRASAGRDNVLILYFDNLRFLPFWLVVKVLLPLPTTQVRNDRHRELHRCMQAIMRDISVLFCILAGIPALRADLKGRPLMHVSVLISWATL